MNIDNVNEKLEMPKDWIEFFLNIFQRQTELMHKYDGIEEKNGVRVPKSPWHLDDKFVQYRIKDFFWRFTEEIAEAMEVRDSVCRHGVENYPWSQEWDKQPDVRHFFEELSDALHFLAEITMVCGIRANTLGDMCEEKFCNKQINVGVSGFSHSVLSYDAAEVIFEIGLAANLLKNKPWKNTHMPTDIHKFRSHVIITWRRFIELWLNLGCERNFIYTIYIKKSRVNEWRQQTNY